MSDTTTPQRLAMSGQGRDYMVISVGGMTCGACANAVHRALSRLPGVVSAEVDLVGMRALARGSAGADDMLAAIEGAGYRASLDGAEMPAPRPRSGCGCGC